MPSLTVPTDVQVGRTVSLYTEPGDGGATLVKRVTTTSVTPSGNVKKTTEETRTTATGETTTTTRTTISGTVQGFEAGKSITLTRPDGTQVTYMLNDAVASCRRASRSAAASSSIRRPPSRGRSSGAARRLRDHQEAALKSLGGVPAHPPDPSDEPVALSGRS